MSEEKSGKQVLVGRTLNISKFFGIWLGFLASHLITNVWGITGYWLLGAYLLAYLVVDFLVTMIWNAWLTTIQG